MLLNFDLNYALSFHRFAYRRSLRLAAKDLGVTTASLRARIMKLEEVLGVRLVHRQGRDLVLTIHGHEFFDVIDRMLAVIERAPVLTSQPKPATCDARDKAVRQRH